jgi:hypothetical protein
MATPVVVEFGPRTSPAHLESVTIDEALWADGLPVIDRGPMRAIGVGLGVLAVRVTTGCAGYEAPAGTGKSTSPAASITTSAGLTATSLPGEGESLAPGRYTRDGFAPPVAFEVGPGWVMAHRIGGFFDVQQDPDSLDVIAVQFAQLTGFATAAEAAASFATVDHVIAGPIEPVTIGGLTGVRVLLETDDPPTSDPPIFREVLTVPAGPLYIASARRLLVHLIDTPDGVLGVLVGGSVAQWDRTLQVSNPVIDSIKIG